MYNKESHDTIDERTFVFQDKDYTILHWFSRTAFTGRAGNFCFQNKKPARQQDGVDEAKQKAENNRSRRKQEAERKTGTDRSTKPAPEAEKNRNRRKQESERKTGTDRSTKPALEAENNRRRKQNGGAENRHRQKHEPGARSGKSRSGNKKRSGKPACRRYKTRKRAILKAMCKTGALNFEKQPGITPYDRARRKTAKKPRPKQNETDRSGQKTAKGPKTKPQFHR